MEYYQVTLNGVDIELRRVNDTQLDTMRRNNPHNVALNAEWRRRKPRPPPTAREIEMEANRTESSLSNFSICAMASESGFSESEIRENIADEAGIPRGDFQVRRARRIVALSAPASERRASECRGEC